MSGFKKKPIQRVFGATSLEGDKNSPCFIQQKDVQVMISHNNDALKIKQTGWNYDKCLWQHLFPTGIPMSKFNDVHITQGKYFKSP